LGFSVGNTVALSVRAGRDAVVVMIGDEVLTQAVRKIGMIQRGHLIECLVVWLTSIVPIYGSCEAGLVVII